MDIEIDMETLEQEQLDYLRRNYDKTMSIPNSTDMNLDILKKPIDDRVLLTPEQEKQLVREVLRRQRDTEEPIKKHSFSITTYFDILANEFVETMDDILNFDGNVENISSIFTKGDRLVFFGTVIFVVCIILIINRRAVNQQLQI
jgi:hypothetical protein